MLDETVAKTPNPSDVPVDSAVGESVISTRFSCVIHLYKTRFSNLFSAIDTYNGHVVAVKTINKKRVMMNHHFKHVERELTLISNISHAHIVKYITWFHDEKRIYYVMELGVMNVAQLLEVHYSGGIPERTVLKIVSHATSGLRYLHHLGIIHRDIKPSNLLLVKEGDSHIVKICDFGCSVHTNEDDVRKSVIGTTPYMAPEIVKGTGHSFPVDIWAIGVTAHELLTNTLPFDGSSPIEICRRIVKEPYVPPVGLSSFLYELLTGCLKKEPAMRPTTYILLNELIF